MPEWTWKLICSPPDPILVAAGEACVRLRSSREISQRGVSERPRTQVLRLLRSRTQASPAAMYGLASTVYPLLKNRRPVASMYQAYSWKPSSASGQNWKSSWYADYSQASKASSSLGINPRRSYLGSIFFQQRVGQLVPRWQNSVTQWLIVACWPSPAWRR